MFRQATTSAALPFLRFLGYSNFQSKVGPGDKAKRGEGASIPPDFNYVNQFPTAELQLCTWFPRQKTVCS